MNKKEFDIFVKLLSRIIKDGDRVTKTQMKLTEKFGRFLDDEQRKEFYRVMEFNPETDGIKNKGV